MSDEEKYYFCSGENCPMKNDCNRFKRDINRSKEFHYAWPPYNHDKNHCSEFDAIDNDPAVKIINQILKDADKN